MTLLPATFNTVFISNRHFSLPFLFKQSPIRFRATVVLLVFVIQYYVQWLFHAFFNPQAVRIDST